MAYSQCRTTKNIVVTDVVVTRSLSRNGGMAEAHGAPVAWQLPGSRLEVVGKESPKSVQRKESIARQSRIR